MYVHVEKEIYVLVEKKMYIQPFEFGVSLDLILRSQSNWSLLKGMWQTRCRELDMGWLRLVGSLKLWVSFTKEPYKRDYILQKRPMILRSLLIVATPQFLFDGIWQLFSMECGKRDVAKETWRTS